MNVVTWFGNLSRRVIRLFSNTGNNLIHYSKVELGSGVSAMSEHEKPVWIKRDGVGVAVVISPELFEELVSAQEELEDIAAVDEALKDEITILGVKYVVGPDIYLDVEVVLDKQGNRLTNARAEEIALEISRESRTAREAEVKELEE
jgi:hypothetical protein